MPSSVIGVVPTMMAPAARSLAATVASAALGAALLYDVPPCAGRPRTCICSLMAMHTPSSGPRGVPAR